MGKVGTFITGFILGGVVVYGTLHYHIIRADDGLHAVAKTSSTFAETYVDIRSFGPNEWIGHNDVAEAIVKAGKTDLMKGVAANALENAVGGAVDGAFRAAGFQPPTQGN